jgi:hypothetical protein
LTYIAVNFALLAKDFITAGTPLARAHTEHISESSGKYG